MDNRSKESRSILMSRIHGKDTKPELIVRKFLFSRGLRYRNNVKTLPGTPDIVLPKYKVAIFIHGCFWHGHSCRQGHLPSSNVDYWTAKITQNRERDQRKINDLEQLDWTVIVIWQCEIRNKVIQVKRLNLLLTQIQNKSTL